MALATLLAREPRLVAEVWHKDRFSADMLLGVASVPLSPLLQECWVDGYAPVLALQQEEERVQVGLQLHHLRCTATPAQHT
jgi:hypothetical protein